MNEESESPELKPGELPARMTPKQIKDLGNALLRGDVFCDAMISENAGPQIFASIFMPLMFVDPAQLQAYADAGFTRVWEYTDKAGPRAINGYPMFTSCSISHQDDFDAAVNHYKKLKAALEILNEE
jgi:hypothetical protein